MKPSLRRSTAALLASSLLFNHWSGATLPFMTIYLTRVYSMSVENIGYALTIALTIGVVFSLGFGILADKFDRKKRYMLIRDRGLHRRICRESRWSITSRWWCCSLR